MAFTGYIDLPVESGGSGGIVSINGDTNPDQTITAGSGISVVTSGGNTTITNTASVTDSFTIMQPDSGTNPTATSPNDTLTFHNADGYLDISGNSGSKTLDFNIDASLLTLINSKQPAGSYLTGLSGDGTASGPGVGAFTLATVNTNTGSFGSSTAIPSFTVNAKGLITAASTNAVIAPAGTLTGNTLASVVTLSSLTTLGIQSQALNMGSFEINALANPVSSQDAATKFYVDNAVNGLEWRPPVEAFADSNIPLTGGSSLVIDGYSANNGDSVLLSAQTLTTQNGVYTVSGIGSAYVLTLRETAVLGFAYLVLDGTVYSYDSFVVSAVSPTVYHQFSGPSEYSFTAPLIQTGTVISIRQATTSTDGYLSSTDWNTFNNKQSTLTFSDSLVNTSGTVTLVGDTASPSTSQYYGTNSLGALGYYNIPGATGANAALSNLSAVAINASLLPGSNNSIDLGSASLDWAHLYVGTQVFAPLIAGLGSTGTTLTVKGGLAATSGAGGQIVVEGANGDSTTTGGAGGNATLAGGVAQGSGNNSGGTVSINGGTSTGSSTGGPITLQCGTGGTGSSTAGATGGTVNINGGTGGAGSATSGNGGGATLKAGSGGNGVAGGAGGTAQVTGGTGGTGSASGGNGGAANLQGGGPGSFAGSAGGAVTVAAGNGTGTGSGGAGGSVTINTGTAGGDNTANQNGGSFTVSVGHSMGSAGGANIQMTAGTGGIGTSTTGAGGGSFTVTAGSGGLGSATGGGGGNYIIQAGVGGNSGTPGTGGFIQFQTASTTSLTEKMRILAAGGVNIVNGPLSITTAGNGLQVSHGTNCKMGTATLSSGTVTVTNTVVTANSYIYLTHQSASGTVGTPYISAKTAGTSFTITSTSGSDASTIAWLIVEAI